MRPVLLALLVSALLAPASARAADVIAPGGGEPTNLIGGCGDPPAAAWCAYVQFNWYPTADRTDGRPGQLPLAFDGVITRVRVPFCEPGGQFAIRVARGVDGSDSSFFDTTVSSPAFPVPDSLRADVPVRLPIASNQLIVLAISAGTRPFVVYEGGGQGPGDGRLLVAPDATGSRLFVEEAGSTTTPPDGISFAATLEPDSDGDGFGDETQDRCPGAAGPADGCAEPGPAPPTPAQGSTPPAPGSTPPAPAPAAGRVVRDLRVRGRTVRYELVRRARVSLRVQARRGGAWRTVRRVEVTGRPGARRVRLPRLRHGWRVVVTARAAGQTTRLVARRPGRR